MRETIPVTWSDEKLILLYCPGRESNSRPPAHRSFKRGQGAPRPYPLGYGGGPTDTTVTTDSVVNVDRVCFSSGGPTVVKCDLYVYSLSSISEVDMVCIQYVAYVCISDECFQRYHRIIPLYTNSQMLGTLRLSRILNIQPRNGSIRDQGIIY